MNRPRPMRKPRPYIDPKANTLITPTISYSKTYYDYIVAFAHMLFYVKDFREILKTAEIPDKTEYAENDYKESLTNLKSRFGSIWNLLRK